MKILIIGANGTIGRKVTAALADRHEIVAAGRNSGDVHVDISAVDLIKKLFMQVQGS